MSSIDNIMLQCQCHECVDAANEICAQIKSKRINSVGESARSYTLSNKIINRIGFLEYMKSAFVHPMHQRQRSSERKRASELYKSPSAQSKCKRKTIYSIYCITLDALCACLHVCCENDIQKITLSYGSTRASSIMNDEAEFSQFLLDIFFFFLFSWTLLASIGHRASWLLLLILMLLFLLFFFVILHSNRHSRWQTTLCRLLLVFIGDSFSLLMNL